MTDATRKGGRAARSSVARTTARPAAQRVGRSIASPRYFQVYVTLRAWVRDGTYRPGQQIPTEAELCEAFGVSRITIRKAIDDLVSQGWLVRHQGRGTFVEMSAARPAATLDIEEAREQVSDLAAATEVRGLRITTVDPDDETRAALALGAGEAVQQARHIRLLRGVPLAQITTFVPLDVAARVDRHAMTRQPMFELLEHSGIRVGEAEQLISATLAGVEAARALGVDVGAPLLSVTRVVYGADGRPVERVVALYRADAYHYRMKLARPVRASDARRGRAR